MSATIMGSLSCNAKCTVLSTANPNELDTSPSGGGQTKKKRPHVSTDMQEWRDTFGHSGRFTKSFFYTIHVRQCAVLGCNRVINVAEAILGSESVPCDPSI